MKTPLKLLAIGHLLSAICLSASAQGTAFTYQGRLNSSGAVANGSYDLRFAIYDAANAGTQQGNLLTNSATAVSNGLFTVTLDFGNQFTGANRWLEIAVRTNGNGAFSSLTPRQALTPAPYAQFAPNAGTAVSAGTASYAATAASVTPGAVSQLGSPGGALPNAVQVNASGFVGIGTNASQAGLQLATGPTIYQPNLQFQVRNGAGGYTNLGNLWGVAASTNHLLAMAAYNGGVTLMDISNPQFPYLLAQLRDGDGVFTNLASAYGVAFNGNVLAVAAYFDNAVTIMSVTNPASPVKLTELRDGVGPFTLLGGALDLAFSTNNLMAVSGYADNAVTLVNMANPAAPTLAGYIQNGFNGFTNLVNPWQLAFSGNLLAVAASGSSAVNLIDVSNPANPQLRAVLKNGVSGFNDLNLGIGGLAISTNNLLAIAAQNSGAVTLVDVSNPANPQLRAVLKDGVGGYNYLAGAIRVAFSGNLLAIAAQYDSAVMLVDVSNPSAPVLKGSFLNGLAGLNNLTGLGGLTFDGSTLAVVGGGGVTLLRPAPTQVDLMVKDFVGIGTAQPEAPLHVVGNMIVQDANVVELRANKVEMGQNTTATGYSSTAMGASSTASGDYSTAMGYNTTASGYSSTAMGYNTTAGGFSSTAMGFSTTASGAYSTAMGYNTTASGNYSTAMGRNTIAANDDATALGLGSAASGWDSVAMGTYTIAAGHYSTAGGFYSQATNQGCFVWADSTSTARFSSSADNQFLIRATGGMGIGTANPQGSLHVYSANNPTIARIQSSGGFGSGRLEFVSNPQGDVNEWRPGYIQSTDNGGFTGGLAFFVNGTGGANKFSSNEVMRVVNGAVGIGTTSPQATLDVNGSLRINQGTVFNRVQDGIFDAGASPTATTKVVTNSFPIAFSTVPNVTATAVNQAGSDYPDAFAVTIRRVTTTNLVINIVRLDSGNPWGQNLRIAYHAWE
ncbi:MAG TPA: hypothetical protein VK327_14225 [Candidatus Paceibacterota bacterium]|nr:hypothetical protein [Candidatus Paceibacterota bacterium]